jgi:hypothetical protein
VNAPPTIALTGISHARYEFTDWPLAMPFTSNGAVYCYAVAVHGADGQIDYQPVFIGQTRPGASQIADHRADACIRSYPVNRLLVYYEQRDAVRDAIELDLARRYTPPCSGIPGL